MRKDIAFMLLATFVGCSKPATQHNEIIKIEVAHYGFSYNDGAATIIDSTLNLVYYGQPGTHNLNYYEGQIDSTTWNAINRRLVAANYKTATAIIDRQIVDVPSYELIVYWNNGKRHLVRDGHATDSIFMAMRWLDSLYRHVALKPARKPVKLETTFQNPPPIPKGIDRVTFPPPQ